MFSVIGIAAFQTFYPQPGIYFGWLTRTSTGTLIHGYLPVVPMTLISLLLMWMVSLATPKPAPATISRYFDELSPRENG
jgi:hypothetical protein